MNKYHNVPKTINGLWFPSKKEAARWQELQLLEKAGVVTELKRQVWFVLIPTLRENGKVVQRECRYRADFVYKENGKLVVEDVKGAEATKNPTYRIKRKLMYYIHKIKILET